MNRRLAVLEKMVQSGQADSFARYGLAMEYRREGRIDDALATFDALRATDPGYVPMYLMAGQMLADAARGAEARAWLEAGRDSAKEKGDAHALGEIETLLASL